MRPIGDLCVFTLHNRCYGLNERLRYANIIRATLPNNFHRA